MTVKKRTSHPIMARSGQCATRDLLPPPAPGIDPHRSKKTLAISIMALIGSALLIGSVQPVAARNFERPDTAAPQSEEILLTANTPSDRGTARAAPAGLPMALPGVYEPSALQQLPDGRILIVEDEAKHAFGLLQLQSDGTPQVDEAADSRLMASFDRKLNDLEALAIDSDGYIYAGTSHSTNNKGKRKPKRERLVRFKIVDGKASETSYFESLRDRLTTSDKLQQLIKAHNGSHADFEATDIEGMVFDPQDKLLLGFKEPLVDGKSLVVSIANPTEMFIRQADPVFDNIFLLDMQGGGIRGMEYDAHTNSYLLLNEVENAEGKNKSQLWRWSGRADSAPRRITPPAFAQMKNVEAVGSVDIDGRTNYLFLSDEGDAKAGEPGQYLRIPKDKLPD